MINDFIKEKHIAPKSFYHGCENLFNGGIYRNPLIRMSS